jgi:hypothetical protein
MNFLEKTGLLSGFDPQNKLVTLSFILRTLMAAYARVNNRIVSPTNETLRFFSSSNDKTIRFLLPSGSAKVMVWSVDYTPKKGDTSDCLTMDLKVKKATPLNDSNSDIYVINLDAPDKRIEGNYYFYVIYYELNGTPHNGYVSNFQEDTTQTDKCNYLYTLSEYVKYLSSGNKNYGEYFTIYGKDTASTGDATTTTSGGLVVKSRIQNRSLITPFLSEATMVAGGDASATGERRWQQIDYIILPVVNVVEKKNRKGEITSTYEYAFASELNEACHLLFTYIKAIHSSKLLHLPTKTSGDDSFSLFIRDTEKDMNSFALDDHKPLIGIFKHIGVLGRHLDRILINDSSIARLLFGTDGRWLLSIIGQDIRLKSPGNGALLQVLLGKCSDESKITMMCSSLCREVDGIYNDLLGKSTVELEDTMIEDANLLRSLSDTSSSYFHLSGIDISHIYHANYSELFRLLSRLRSGGSDYFVPILQPQMRFTGNRQGGTLTDSTKLMSIFNETKYQKVFRDANGNVLGVSRVEGGMFLCMKRDTALKEKSVLCPFGQEMKEISEIYNLYGHNNSLFMPLGLNHTQLTHLNQHQPITIRFLSDGTLLPQQAKPFKSNPAILPKLPEFANKVFEFITCETFITNLQSYCIKWNEYMFACRLAKLLGQKSIFNLLDDPTPAILSDTAVTSGNYDLSFAENNVPHILLNVVINSTTSQRIIRERIFTQNNLGDIVSSVKEEDLSWLDKINGFLLSADWRRSNINNAGEAFYKHLAIASSVLYSRLNITTISTVKREVPMTEAILPNFGIVPHIQNDNGDVLIRTLNGSLSQKSNGLSMLLFAKHWFFVVGSLPKATHSIDTTRRCFEVKVYTRDTPGVMSFKQVISTITSATNSSFARGETFLELFRKAISGTDENVYRLKPERRNLIMFLLSKEWKSLINLPPSKKINPQPSFREFHKLIHVGLKSSFVIDGKVYNTEEHRNRIIKDFLDSL